MKPWQRCLCVASGFFLGFVLPAARPAAAEPASLAAPGPSARVSDVAGTLSVRGADEDEFSVVDRNAAIREGDTLWTAEDGRAEVELERGAWVRLAESTKLEFLRLPGGSRAGAELRLWTGSVYLDLPERFDAPLRLATPVGDIAAEPDSVVRVDLDREESARVSVFHGRARVLPDEGPEVRLSAGERSYLAADGGAERPRPFDRDALDGFDRYQRARVDYWIERPLPRELEREIVGARELRDYGSWIVLDGVSYWRPRCDPDWRPYSRGYWAFYPGWGYTWIDYYPWGYATCHYGRWLYRPVYGWLWCPGYVWAPAYVYWSSFGSFCGWAPLDPWNRPCFVGPGSFTFLNFVIDLRSWTFCRKDRFFFARHHWRFRDGGRHLFAGDEVRLDPREFRLVRDVHREIGVPRERVRGLTVTADGRPVRERVLQLETRLPEARLRRIEGRFGTPALRDRIAARRETGIERLQQPGSSLAEDRILQGDEALARLRPGRSPVARVPDEPPARPEPGRIGGNAERRAGLPDREREDARRSRPAERPPSAMPDRSAERPERPGGAPPSVDRPERPEPVRPGVTRPEPEPPSAERPSAERPDRDERFRRGDAPGIGRPRPAPEAPEPGRTPAPSAPGPRYRDFPLPPRRSSGAEPGRAPSRDERFRRDAGAPALPSPPGDSRGTDSPLRRNPAGAGTPGRLERFPSRGFDRAPGDRRFDRGDAGNRDFFTRPSDPRGGAGDRAGRFDRGPGLPGDGSPAYRSPGYGSPGYGSPGYGSPGYGAPGYGSRSPFGSSLAPYRGLPGRAGGTGGFGSYRSAPSTGGSGRSSAGGRSGSSGRSLPGR